MSGFSPDFGAWQTYAPVLSSGSGTLTSTNTLSGRYKQLGKIVMFQAVGAIGVNGTGAGYLRFSLPVPVNSGGTYPISAINSSTSVLFSANVNGALGTANILTSAGAYPGTDSISFTIGGIYEAA